MKIYLIFSDDEENESKLALKGADMFCCLFDFDQQLRSWLKYDHGFKNADEALEGARERLHQIMEAHAVNLDEFG